MKKSLRNYRLFSTEWDFYFIYPLDRTHSEHCAS